ncbi:MAG: nucleotidyltransferase family protein [Thiomicrorhabdus chilensis]|uniref:nucleotidyltransferase family protein n=1 Tax=Thiomicrorhabdus chilensis TaxID=63656 RepID=UPI00299E2425|nr:nucleotidyltransferase family protein [Thiomicrorhabdus chilensis]MDX1346908.1 nucleotidyltransferase family protein [Thiomicrorhabdus chilensis]
MNLFDWRRISVDETASIKQALTVLDKEALQIVLVVNQSGILMGTLTDGDVRRALLRGVGLDDCVLLAMNAMPTVGLQSQSETAWKRKILEKSIRHLPIVDAEQHVIGLFYDKKEVQKRLNPVVLMLGGLGTRLRPLTESVPKPMLRVGDRPILETIVTHIAEQGFVNFYFCINYLGEQIRSYFGDGSQWGVNIEYIEEDERMGTAGALSLLPEVPELPFIVMNGDLLTKVNLSALLDFHTEHHNIATACVREYAQQVPYGVVEIDGARVTQLVEKPVYRYFVNAGIYALSPQAMDKVPEQAFYDMPTLIDEVLAEKGPVGGFPITEYWMDIGQMPDFEQAQADYEVHFQKRVTSNNEQA